MLCELISEKMIGWLKKEKGREMILKRMRVWRNERGGIEIVMNDLNWIWIVIDWMTVLFFHAFLLCLFYHFPYLLSLFSSFFFHAHYVIWTKTKETENLSYHWSKVNFIKGGCYRSFCCFEGRSREWECDGMFWLWIYDDSRNWMWEESERGIRIDF